MRMNSHRSKHEVILSGELDSAIEAAGPIAIPDGNYGFDTRFARTSNHLLAVCLELLAIEMGVRIDKHREVVSDRWQVASCEILATDN
jgi:hypothetical protein